MSASDKGLNIVRDWRKSEDVDPWLMKIELHKWGVKSTSTGTFYIVELTDEDKKEYQCDCPSFRYRCGVEEERCKHIYALLEAKRKEIKLLTLDECVEQQEKVKDVS